MWGAHILTSWSTLGPSHILQFRNISYRRQRSKQMIISIKADKEKHNPQTAHTDMRLSSSISTFRDVFVSCILVIVALTCIISNSKQERIRLRSLGSSYYRSLAGSSLCPVGREFIYEYAIAPNASKFSEVSYMVHSSQKYYGNDVVWCVVLNRCVFVTLIYLSYL